MRRRFSEHCAGKVRASKGFIPLEPVYTQDFNNEKEARGFEQKIKKQRLLKEQIIRNIDRLS